MTARELDGIVMELISAISKTLLRKRVEAFTLHLLSKYNFFMMMTKYIWHIATLILIRMLLNYFRGFVNLSRKIEYVRLLYVKLSLGMTARWL